MYAIKATLRKSRKAGQPGYIVFRLRDKSGAERIFATGVSSTEEEMTTTHRDYIIRGIKCLYDIIAARHSADGDGDLNDIADAFRNRLDNLSKIDTSGFKVDRKIASVGSPFKQIIENDYLKEEMYLDGGPLTISRLEDFVTGLLNEGRREMRAGTANNYRSVRNIVSEFAATLPAGDHVVDCNFVSSFHAWLKSKSLTDSTVSFYMRLLRAVLNKAKENGLIDMSDNWFGGLIGNSYDADDSKSRRNSLTKAEIRDIASVNLDIDPLMKLARDLYMFSFYCRGMELFDILNLKPENIHGDIIVYNKRLTGKQQVVKIEPKARKIIDRYANDSDGYIFSAITKYTKSREYATLRHLISPKLSELGKLLGIETPLVFSTARNTWKELTRESNLSSMLLN